MLPSRALCLAVSATALALALTACGDDDTGSTSSSTTPTVATTTPTPTPTTSAPTTPTSSPTGKAKIPPVQNAIDFTKKPLPAPAGPEAARPAKLLTEDLIVGKGAKAKAHDTVDVRYVGTYYRSGEEFDASWKGGSDPVSFSLDGVVPGFGQGIIGMAPGGRRTIVIPAELGYGAAGSGDIPPDSDLVFVVDLIKATTP